ncbi:MAG TPA: type II toxin-antitoxin system RelE/ParE family toxin [bacterium]|nr:type II toxin-antitoxin system RelE/ParE family toxin [bacterium]
MKYSLHPGAAADIVETAAFYEARQPGLGFEFTQEVYSAVARILEYPEAWTTVSPNTRRALLKRFPFGVIYKIKSDHLLILAVSDLRRLPGYWKDRA